MQCAYAVLGALMGAVGYVATLPAWGSLRFTGHSLGIDNMWLGLLLLLLALAVVVTLAGVTRDGVKAGGGDTAGCFGVRRCRLRCTGSGCGPGGRAGGVDVSGFFH